MRIVDRVSFLAMPPGTFYRVCHRKHSGDDDAVWVKGGTIGGTDWACLLIGDVGNEAYRAMRDSQISAPMELDYGRDGRFELGETYMVFELGDLQALRCILDEAIAAAAVTSGPVGEEREKAC